MKKNVKHSLIIFIFTFTLMSLLTLLSNNSYATSSLPFSDVKDTSWYYTYLKELYENNIINGMGDGTFGGTSELKKDQLLKLIITTVNGYADYTKKNSTDQWFKPYLDMCRTMGIEDDVNILSKTNENGYTIYYAETENLTEKFSISISREDVAKYLVKAYKLGKTLYDIDMINENDQAITTYLKEKFSDYNKISQDARYYVYYACQIGLMNGYTDGTFGPQKTLTRSETTAIIYRLRNERKTLISNGDIDFDKLESMGYVYSTGKSEEKLVSSNEGNIEVDKSSNSVGITYTKEELLAELESSKEYQKLSDTEKKEMLNSLLQYYGLQ